MSVCDNKKWFSNKKEAKNYAKQIKQKFSGEQNAYSCPICDGWHLTTIDKKRQRAMRRNGSHGKTKK